MTTAENVPGRTAVELANPLLKVTKMYARGGFVVKTCYMDKEFDKMKEIVGLLEVNTAAAQEHVAEIERMIWLVKERVRCYTSLLPFPLIPQLVIVHIVYNVIMWLNPFPPKNGITRGFSPRELVTGRTLDFRKDCRADVGAYVEASPDHIVTNTNIDRTDSCIALGPSGNRQGSVKCLNLDNGKVLVRRTVRKMPWPDDLPKKVNVLAKKNIKKAIIRGKDIKFMNRHEKKFDWYNDDIDEMNVKEYEV